MITADLSIKDPEIFNLIQAELNRQQDTIELIASENIVSPAVLEAQGSILTNKYAEGYPAKRYYGGCEYVDEIENIAIDRVKKLFGCSYANVQPHSGSQANQGAMLALIKPGDTILGMALNAGGHLTHGAAPNLSGKWFNAISYGVKIEDGLIDYDEVEKLAELHKPRLIIAGGSAYPRQIDFAHFRKIADKVGAFLLADIAHYSGLVATNLYNSPFEHAHVVTMTTHKTLRGPRGGVILAQTDELAKQLNSAIFPGLQGGPLMHVIAAKAVAFQEALQPEFKTYMQQVVKNSQKLAQVLLENNIDIVTGGTDCHLVLVDLRKYQLTGKQVELSLGKAGLTCNKNAIPHDCQSPFITSGIRLGTPAGTSRGFTETEFSSIATWIASIILSLAHQNLEHTDVESMIAAQVKRLCEKFPIEGYRAYQHTE